MTTALVLSGPRVIALIPARGGSKGLPRKNLRLLGGMPLIVHTIRAAQEAKSIDLVVVSTEDSEIAEVAIEHGAMVIARPSDLAIDTAQNDAVTRHALGLIRRPSHPDDIVVLLQPTSPLRQARDIDGCIAVFRSTGAAAAMTVCEVDVHPGKCLLLHDGLIEPFTTAADMEARRQDMAPVFRQNGAVYVVGAEDFMAHGRFYRRPCAAYRMSRRDSIDIDEELDLHMAEIMLVTKGRPTL